MILVCLATIVINTSNEQWNAHDTKTMKSVKKRCKIHYKNAPCLVKFTKTAKKTYNAICGVKK